LVVGKWTKKTGGVVLLVEEIPHQLIGALSHYLQGFYTASINSISMVKQTAHFLKLIHPKPKPDHMVVEGSLNRNFRQYGELKTRCIAQQ